MSQKDFQIAVNHTSALLIQTSQYKTKIQTEIDRLEVLLRWNKESTSWRYEAKTRTCIDELKWVLTEVLH